MKPQLLVFLVVIAMVIKLLAMIPIEIYVLFGSICIFILAKELHSYYQAKSLPTKDYSNYVVPYDFSKDVLDVEVERIEPKPRINKSQNFSPDFPPNSSTYFTTIVAGVTFRKDDVKRFFAGINHQIEFERDITNKHDKNAIKIIGISSGIRNFIGFVPKEFSKQLVLSKLENIAKPYLERIFYNSDDFYEVRFKVVGPSKLKRHYEDAFNKQPMSSHQKYFYKFFQIPIPKKLTYEEANKFIKDEQSRLQKLNPSSLDEYEAYLEIFEEFDTSYFRSDYEIKKPTTIQMEEALESLINQGYSYKLLIENIDYVVDRLKQLNPQLDRS